MAEESKTEELRKIIEDLDNLQIILIVGVAMLLLYLVLTKTQRGRDVRRKFRILPKLIPIEDYDEIKIKNPEKIDGSQRQLKNEIIDNEHEILKNLVGEDSPEILSGFDESDAQTIPEEEENIPLANQNFPDIKGKVENAAEGLEYCAECTKPVKKEWKACPYCGEFLEVYESEED